MVTKKDFVCKRCGKCCKPIVVLNDNDVARIKSMGYDEDFFLADDIFEKKRKILRQANDECIFLSRSNDCASGCLIYSNRPDVCRKYPFIGIKEIKRCCPSTMFEDAMREARELITKRGFI